MQQQTNEELGSTTLLRAAIPVGAKVAMQAQFLKSRAKDSGKKTLHAGEFNQKLITALKELMPTATPAKLIVYFVVESLHAPQMKSKVRDWEGTSSCCCH